MMPLRSRTSIKCTWVDIVIQHSLLRASADYLEVPLRKIKRAKVDRTTPEHNLERMKLLMEMFEGFVPEDMTDAIIPHGRRGHAGARPMCVCRWSVREGV